MKSRSVNLINLINYKLPYLRYCKVHETRPQFASYPTSLFTSAVREALTNQRFVNVKFTIGLSSMARIPERVTKQTCSTLIDGTQRKENLPKSLFNLRKMNPKLEKGSLKFTSCLAILLTKTIGFPKEKFTSLSIVSTFGREALASHPTFGQVSTAAKVSSTPEINANPTGSRSQSEKYLFRSKVNRLVLKKLEDSNRSAVRPKVSFASPKVAAVQKTSEDYNKNLLIMFSGGQDSITLLVLLFGIQSQNSFKLNILWNHHLWHKDSFFITRHILKLSFLFKISTHSAIALAPVKTELDARQWRLKVSRRLSNFYKYQRIMQAHTGTDKIETLLLNLFRGTNNTSPFHSTDFSFIFSQTQKRKLYFN